MVMSQFCCVIGALRCDDVQSFCASSLLSLQGVLPAFHKLVFAHSQQDLPHNFPLKCISHDLHELFKILEITHVHVFCFGPKMKRFLSYYRKSCLVDFSESICQSSFPFTLTASSIAAVPWREMPEVSTPQILPPFGVFSLCLCQSIESAWKHQCFRGIPHMLFGLFLCLSSTRLSFPRNSYLSVLHPRVPDIISFSGRGKRNSVSVIVVALSRFRRALCANNAFCGFARRACVLAPREATMYRRGTCRRR